MNFKYFLFLLFLPLILLANPPSGLPLYYWHKKTWNNFGDYLSLKMVERIVGQPVKIAKQKGHEKNLLAIGSILICGKEGDVIWGSGLKGNKMDLSEFSFSNLDIRAVRGPLTRQFLQDKLHIECPEVYGDPALLVPYLFPEFRKKAHPKYDYIIIPHYSEEKLFPKRHYPNVVYPTDPWDEIIEKITDSRFVIASSLHGIIVAEAFGIPARFLRITEHEPLFKYQDYYYGTDRPDFLYATSIEEALAMGGEPPFKCDLNKLYESFPFEYWGLQAASLPPINLEERAQDFVLSARQIEIENYPGAFNPSIIPWNGSYLLSFRTRAPFSQEIGDIGLIQLDEEFNPKGEAQILPLSFGKTQVPQDPRLIQVGTRLFLIYNLPDMPEHPKLRRMYYAELLYDGISFFPQSPQLISDYPYQLPFRQEKNWVPFDYEGELLLSYTLVPHTVLKPIEFTPTCKLFAESAKVPQWPWGILRGGTPALKVGSEYLSFFHSSIH